MWQLCLGSATRVAATTVGGPRRRSSAVPCRRYPTSLGGTCGRKTGERTCWAYEPPWRASSKTYLPQISSGSASCGALMACPCPTWRLFGRRLSCCMSEQHCDLTADVHVCVCLDKGGRGTATSKHVLTVPNKERPMARANYIVLSTRPCVAGGASISGRGIGLPIGVFGPQGCMCALLLPVMSSRGPLGLCQRGFGAGLLPHTSRGCRADTTTDARTVEGCDRGLRDGSRCIVFHPTATGRAPVHCIVLPFRHLPMPGRCSTTSFDVRRYTRIATPGHWGHVRSSRAGIVCGSCNGYWPGAAWRGARPTSRLSWWWLWRAGWPSHCGAITCSVRRSRSVPASKSTGSPARCVGDVIGTRRNPQPGPGRIRGGGSRIWHVCVGPMPPAASCLPVTQNYTKAARAGAARASVPLPLLFPRLLRGTGPCGVALVV